MPPFCALPRKFVLFKIPCNAAAAALCNMLISPHPWGSTLRAFSLTLEVQFLLSLQKLSLAFSLPHPRNAPPRSLRSQASPARFALPPLGALRMLRGMGRNNTRKTTHFAAPKNKRPGGFPRRAFVTASCQYDLHERVGEKEYKGYDQRVDSQRLDHGETYEHGGHDLA